MEGKIQFQKNINKGMIDFTGQKYFFKDIFWFFVGYLKILFIFIEEFKPLK